MSNQKTVVYKVYCQSMRGLNDSTRFALVSDKGEPYAHIVPEKLTQRQCVVYAEARGWTIDKDIVFAM